MKQKKIDTVKLQLPIPLKAYQQHINIKNIKDTDGLLDTDVFHSIVYEESEGDMFNEPGKFEVPYIICLRERLETDEEYLHRMRECETIYKDREDKEKELYLRLKAKYETNEG